MEFHLGTTLKFAFDFVRDPFVMLEHKQKQGFEFIHMWPKWKLKISIYFNANNRVGLAAAVSISASLASLPSLLQGLSTRSAPNKMLIRPSKMHF